MPAIKVVPIFPSTQPPPTLPDGHAERIQFGWDTNLSSDGHHGVLSDLPGDDLPLGPDEEILRGLNVPSVNSWPLARVWLGSTSPGSSIAQGNTEKADSSQDVAAMQRMSGCAFEPTTKTGAPSS